MTKTGEAPPERAGAEAIPVKTGAKVVRHGRHITFQMAEVAISRPLFAETLRLIDGPRSASLPP